MATSSADCSARIWRTSDLPSNLLQRGAEDVARAARSEAGRRARPTPADEDGGGVGGLRPRDTVGRSELRPIVVLRDPTARWVWDCAFAADSQYLFTGVLLWRLLFLLFLLDVTCIKTPQTILSHYLSYNY